MVWDNIAYPAEGILNTADGQGYGDKRSRSDKGGAEGEILEFLTRCDLPNNREM